MLDELENHRQNYLEKLKAYRSYYLPNGERREDGFEVLQEMPEGVVWILEEENLVMQGTTKGMQEMTMVIQAFSHDYETIGLFHEKFLLLKHTEPAAFDELVVISMPGEAWAFWGGKMGDVAFQQEMEELFFNWMGFYDPIPVDIGIRLTDMEEEGE